MSRGLAPIGLRGMLAGAAATTGTVATDGEEEEVEVAIVPT